MNANHYPADCPRKRPSPLNMVQEDEQPPGGYEQEEAQDLQQAMSDHTLSSYNAEVRLPPPSQTLLINEISTHSNNLSSSSQQRPEPSTFNIDNSLSEHFDNGDSWLEDVTGKIRKLESRLTENQPNQVRKAKSPTIAALLYGTKIICTSDEGAELNCIDYAVVLSNNIPFTVTKQTAAGAGSTKMCLMGETTSNVCLQVCSKKHDIKWNLGKLVIVKNLGVPLLIGEPGKRDNTIITIPQESILTKDVSGNLVTLPYHASQGHDSGFIRQFLCTVPEATTLYPNETISVPVPTTFVGCVAAVTPRLEFSSDWPTPKVLYLKKDTVEFHNETKRTILLPKGKPFADLRDTFSPKINRTYDLFRQNNDHFILPERPTVASNKSYIADVKIDPDNQLSPVWRDKFHSACEQFSHVITPIPGRYNGYYGRVDNSLNFVGHPPPSIKARLPKYNDEMIWSVSYVFPEVLLMVLCDP